MNQRVKKEVMEAYSDFHDSKNSKKRNLNFLASGDVSRDEAYKIMKSAVPEGYNGFSPELIKRFPADARFTIAREGSVCLYVRGEGLPIGDTVLADECSESGEEVRYWWD